MHETHDLMGKLIDQQVVEGEDNDEVKGKLKNLYVEAMADPNVAEIKQTLVRRNGPCPCDSGQKFKNCCHPSQGKKRKPGVPSREEMYKILKRRSEELKTVPEVLLDQGVTLEEYREEQRKESLRKRGLL